MSCHWLKSIRWVNWMRKFCVIFIRIHQRLYCLFGMRRPIWRRIIFQYLRIYYQRPATFISHKSIWESIQWNSIWMLRFEFFISLSIGYFKFFYCIFFYRRVCFINFRFWSTSNHHFKPHLGNQFGWTNVATRCWIVGVISRFGHHLWRRKSAWHFGHSFKWPWHSKTCDKWRTTSTGDNIINVYTNSNSTRNRTVQWNWFHILSGHSII